MVDCDNTFLIINRSNRENISKDTEHVNSTINNLDMMNAQITKGIEWRIVISLKHIPEIFLKIDYKLYESKF